MIEDILCRESSNELQKKVAVLEERLRSLEQKTSSPAPSCGGGGSSGGGVSWIDALKDLEIVLPPVVKQEPSPVVAVKQEPSPVVAVKQETALPGVEEVVVVEEEEEVVEEEEEVVEEVEEEEVEEEEEEVEEEVEEEEEEVVEEVAEEEEEGVEEITYKGKTYYKDSDNNIYNATGDELGDPIGVWDVSRQRVLFKRPL
jgi:DNA-binding transcriptional MerR regulator